VTRPRQCPTGPVTLGIDISAHQGEIDWTRVAQSGAQFAFIRAMEGVAIDTQFRRNWAGAKQAGLLRGAYVYFRARHGGDLQAQMLLRLLGDDVGELPPACDIETLDEQTPSTVVSRMQDWVRVVRPAVGKRPVIYSGSFWHWQISSAHFADLPLWTPDYTSMGCPGVPKGWDTWTIWQYTSSGAVPGIYGRVDMNWFRGNVDQLRALGADGWPAWKWLTVAALGGVGYWAWRRYGRSRKRLAR